MSAIFLVIGKFLAKNWKAVVLTSLLASLILYVGSRNLIIGRLELKLEQQRATYMESMQRGADEYNKLMEEYVELNNSLERCVSFVARLRERVATLETKGRDYQDLVEELKGEIETRGPSIEYVDRYVTSTECSEALDQAIIAIKDFLNESNPV